MVWPSTKINFESVGSYGLKCSNCRTNIAILSSTSGRIRWVQSRFSRWLYFRVYTRPERWSSSIRVLSRIKLTRIYSLSITWWWDGCVVCLWKIGREVRSCTFFWVFRAWQKWWGMVDWGSLGMLNVRTEMIGCRPVEMWWWQGWDVWAGVGRHGENV